MSSLTFLQEERDRQKSSQCFNFCQSFLKLTNQFLPLLLRQMAQRHLPRHHPLDLPGEIVSGQGKAHQLSMISVVLYQQDSHRTLLLRLRAKKVSKLRQTLEVCLKWVYPVRKDGPLNPTLFNGMKLGTLPYFTGFWMLDADFISSIQYQW